LAYEVPTGVPASFPAGTTLTFKVPEDSQFPVSEGWAYNFYLVGYLGATTTGVGADQEYTFTIAATSTDDILAGAYRWEIRASLAGAVYPVSSGRLAVTENSAVLYNADSRTWTEKMIVAIQTLLYGSGTIPEVESYQIHGRQLVKMERAELMKWLAQLEGELSVITAGGKRPPIRIQFGQAR
jgi:uncharacterized protein YaiE (UPF0345 family)